MNDIEQSIKLGNVLSSYKNSENDDDLLLNDQGSLSLGRNILGSVPDYEPMLEDSIKESNSRNPGPSFRTAHGEEDLMRSTYDFLKENEEDLLEEQNVDEEEETESNN